MRSHLFAVLLLVLVAPAARAHPGVGIVGDRAGNVYYTDLVHVWRIAPNGRKAIVVRNVHTHELSIDAAGVVYGEDSRFMGGDRWRHRVWRRMPDGRVEDVVPWTDGFWREYGFVRDSEGASYWTRCPDRVCTIRRRARDGRVTDLPSKARIDGNILFRAPAPRGALYVLDRDALKRLTSSGDLQTVADSLGGAPLGMISDPDGTVHVAVYHARTVLRIRADGRRTVVARTPALWGPSGIMRTATGDLWILEYSTKNEARVRRVKPDGRVTVY